MNTRDDRGTRQRTVWKLVLAVAVLGFGYWIPQYYGAVVTYQVGQFLTIAIAALGVNLVTGYGGQISIGHSAFFGVGAYATAIFMVESGWPPVPALAVSVLVAFLFGILCGFPALRLKGLYLAIVTLALATVFPAVLNRFSSVTGGAAGMQNVPSLHAPSWSGLADDQWICYVIMLCTGAVFVLAKLGLRGRSGRALRAIRENDLAASVYGVNRSKYNVLVFGISAAVTAFAGGLFTLQGNLLSSGNNYFSIVGAINLLVAVVIGGAGTILGPVIGASVTFYLPSLLEDYNPAVAPLLYGTLLIVLILLMPSGVMGLLTSGRAWLGRKFQKTDLGDPGVGPPPDGVLPPDSGEMSNLDAKQVGQHA